MPNYKKILASILLFIIVSFSANAADEITLTFTNTNLCANASYDVTYTSNMAPGTVYKLKLFKNGVEIRSRESTANPFVFTTPFDAVTGSDYSLKISAGVVEAAPLENISLTNMTNVHFKDQYGFQFGQNPYLCPGSSIYLDATLQGQFMYGPTQPLVGAFTYQWQKDGVDIANTTKAITITSSGTYSLSATQNGCSYSSQTYVNSATFTQPFINFDNNPKYFCEGNSVKLASKATSTTATFQWQKEFADIPGATSRELTVSKNGNYRLKVTDSNCTSANYSQPAILTFGSALPASITIANKELCGSDPAANNVSASVVDIYDYFQGPEHALAFKYQKDGVDIPNSEGRPFLKIMEPGTYRLVTNQGTCTATSNEVEVTQESQLTKPTLITSGNTTPVSSICTGSRRLTWNATGNIYKDNVLVASSTNTFVTTTASTYKLVRGEGSSCMVESDPVNVTFGSLIPVITVNKTTVCGSNDYTFMYFDTSFLTGTFTYQWQLNGQDLVGQTSPAFSVYGTDPMGTFRLKVTNGSCTEFSNEVIISTAATASFTIRTQNDETNNLACSSRLLNINTNYNFAYYSNTSRQWYKNGSILPGETGASLNTSLAGDYQLVINNTGCTATSNTITVQSDFVPKPSITQTYTATGASATLTAHACTGTVRWWAAATGGSELGTGTTFETPILNTTTDYYASCTGNNCESARTKRTVVLDQVADQITVNLAANTQVCAGSSFSVPFNSTFGNSALYTVKFYKNGVEIASSEASTNPIVLNIPASEAFGTDYSIKISAFGIESNTVALTVLNPVVSQSTIITGGSGTLTATGCGMAGVKWVNTANSYTYTQNPLFTGPFTTATTFNVSCVTASCETAPLSYNVVITEPNINITSYPTSLCAGTNFNVAVTTNLPSNSYISAYLDKAGQQPINIGGGQIVSGQITLSPYQYSVIQGPGYALRLVYSNYSVTTAAEISIGNFNNTTFIDLNSSSLNTSQNFCANTEAILGAQLVSFGTKLNFETIAGVNYQWQKNGVNFGANQNTLNTTESGTYRLVASYAACTSTSQNKQVSFSGISNVTISPSQINLCDGQPVLIFPSYNTTTATYQWRLNDVNIPEATSREYLAGKSGKYSVQIIDKTCTYFSNYKSLNFGDALVANLFANEKNLCNNNSIYLDANFYDGAPLSTTTASSIIWQKNGVDMPGMDTRNISVNQPGNYRYKITLGTCLAYSNEHEIISASQYDKPYLSVQAGNNFEFCTGNYPLYWNTGGTIYKNNNIVATNNSFFAATEAGTYKLVRGAGTGCAVESDPVVITKGSLSPQIYAPRTQLCGNSENFNIFYQNQSQNTGGFSYVWEKDNVPIINYSQNFVNVSQPGTYRVKVTNGTCSEYSNEIIITRNDNLNFDLTHLNNQNINLACSNRLVSFDTGNLYNFQFKWFRNGIEIANPEFNKLTTAEAGTYTVTATGSGCNATSYPLVVNSDYVPKPSITQTYTATGASTTLTAYGCTGIVHWWEAATGGSELATGTTFTSPILNSPTDYFASCATTTCESARAKRTVVLDQVTDQINFSLANTQLCAGTSISVPFTSNFGTGTVHKIALIKNGLEIASNETSGNPLSLFIPTSVEYGTDYSIKISTFGIESNAVAVTVLNPVVSQGTIITGTSGTLTATGCGTASVFWFKADGSFASGGNQFTTPILNTATTYSVICQATNCQTSPKNYEVVLTEPVLTITNYPTSMCAGSSYLLDITTNFPSNTFFNIALVKAGQPNLPIGGGLVTNGQLTINPSQYQVISGSGYAIKISHNTINNTTPSDITIGNVFNAQFYDQNGYNIGAAKNYCIDTEAILGANLIKSGNAAMNEILSGVNFQWQKDGVNIGVNQNPINITAAGNYKVIATVGACTTTSNTFAVQFGGIYDVSILPNSTNFCEGTEIKLTPNFESTSATYQWKLNNINIPGAIERILPVTKSGPYSLIINDKTCSTETQPKTISFSDALEATLFASEKTLCGNNGITLNSGGYDGLSPLYNNYNLNIIRQKNGVDLPAQTNRSLNVTEAGTYRFKLTQGSCVSYCNEHEIITGTKWDKPMVNIPNTENPNFCDGNYQIYWSGFSGTVYKDNVIVAQNTNQYTTTLAGTYTYERQPGNSCSVLSDPFVLTKGTLTPKITANKIVLCGTNDFLVLNYNNTAQYLSSFTFQWEKDGVPISSAINNSRAITLPGTYRLLVTNGNCTEYSNEIIITRNDNLVMDILPDYNISLQSTQNLGCSNRLSGLQTSFNFFANGFTWYRNGTPIPNVTSSGLKTPEAGTYTVSANFSGCMATSNPFVVNSDYVPQPTITQSPTQVGASATLTASACNGTINWYNSQTSTNSLGTGLSFNTPILNSSLPYFADCTTASCKSTREKIDVILTSCTQMVTIKTGSWNDPTVWSCNRIPTVLDSITISFSHIITIPDNYIAKLKDVILSGEIKMGGINASMQFR